MVEQVAEAIPGLVSVIIPVHNRPGVLQEAVRSALEQTYRPLEIVIVDDGSSDSTGLVADDLASAHPGVIQVIHQENGGPGVARQRGLEQSRGEYIQFLDSDDLLLPGKFAAQVSALEGQPECEDKAPQPSCGDAAPAAPVVEGSGAFAGVASCVGGADGTTSSMLGVGAPQKM